MSQTTAVNTHELSRSQLRKAVFGGSAGVFVEFFDYGIYGFLASTITVVFFPPEAATAGLIMTWGIFALTFLIRPLGGLIIGAVADKVGRRSALVISLTLMTVATTAIGLLPTYAAVGIFAPILLLLCRLVQGFSAGGEVASAYSFVAENAPDHRRGFYTSLPQFGSYTAMLCGTGLGVALATLLPDGALEGWAWRIAFLIAAPLGILGFWIRRSLNDTVTFLQAQGDGETTANPISATVRDASNVKRIVKAICLALLNSSGYYILFNYMPSYLEKEVGMAKSDSLIVTLVAVLIMLIGIPTTGALSDRVGRKKVLIGSAAACAALVIPCYALIAQGHLGTAMVGAMIMAAAFCGHAAVLNVTLAELFPTKIRGTGYSLGYNLSTAVFGGAGPLVMTSLIAATSVTAIPAYYVMITAVGTGIAALTIRETSGAPLS